MINLGNNSNSKLEIVSSLNSFNLAYYQYHFNDGNCVKKYNLKIYFGTIQSVAHQWNFDTDSSRQNLLGGVEKSGSWPQKTRVQNSITVNKFFLIN